MPIEEKEICGLNLFFGIIIIFSSILIFISFFLVNINTQIIIFSFNLIIIGVAFTSIGIPDKNQGVEAANMEIWGGFIITIAGLICFFISLISSNLIIQIQFIINVIFIIAGIVAVLAPYAEKDTRTWSKWIMVGSGIIMAFLSAFYIVIPLLEPFILIITNIGGFIYIMNILLFISIFIHGLARIIMYNTGIYT